MKGTTTKTYFLFLSTLALFFTFISCENCENSVTAENGKLKIKNMDTTSQPQNLTHIKISVKDSDNPEIDIDCTVAPEIIKIFDLEPNQYIVYVYSENDGNFHCSCTINSGKTTYLRWSYKENMGYILYEVDSF